MATAVDTVHGGRVVALDAMRGLVLLLLLPDTRGGFAIYRIAMEHPGHWLWDPLAQQLTHAPWEGITVWDLVMPGFAFVIGASLWFSQQAHAADVGVGWWSRSALFLRRSTTLVLLGVLVTFQQSDHLVEIAPFILIFASLPIARWLGAMRGRAVNAVEQRRIEWTVWLIALCATLAVVAARWHTLSQSDIDGLSRVVLVQLGVAYFFASRFVDRDAKTQVIAACLIVALYGLAFLAYSAAVNGPAPAGESIATLAWQNGANVAAAFDLWLFDLLPREQTPTLDPHGYHALQIVPLTAVMLTGLVAARWLQRHQRAQTAPWPLLGAGVLLLAIAGVLTALHVPPIKSIWTPTFVLASMGIMLIVLWSLGMLAPRLPRAIWLPLVVLGSNSLLLYVCAIWIRWRFVSILTHFGGAGLIAGPYGPLIESLWVLACMWTLAYVLYRYRVLLRA